MGDSHPPSGRQEPMFTSCFLGGNSPQLSSFSALVGRATFRVCLSYSSLSSVQDFLEFPSFFFSYFPYYFYIRILQELLDIVEKYRIRARSNLDCHSVMSFLSVNYRVCPLLWYITGWSLKSACMSQHCILILAGGTGM